MKKYLLYLCILCITLVTFSCSESEENYIITDSEKTVTAVMPVDTDNDGYYNISTIAHLRWISENDSSWTWNYELDNNINASNSKKWNIGDHDNNPNTPDSASGWKPIGRYIELHKEEGFTGEFLGNGYTISNLYINRPNDDMVGFFGCLKGGATIKDLNIKDATITGDDQIGIMVGFNVSRNSWDLIQISNCSVSGKIISRGTGNKTYAVVGTGKGIIGGFCGMNYAFSRKSKTIIRNCIADVEICASTVNSDLTGGFCGYNAVWNGGSAIIKNCSAKGQITAHNYVGGFCGANYDNVGTIEIIECQSNTHITAIDSCGGFCGLSDGLVSDCMATGKLTASNHCGGFIGANVGVIQNSYTLCEISNPHSHGFFGINYVLIARSFWNTDITDSDAVRGCIGLSTKDMKKKSTYTQVGWNFENVWDISRRVNNGYPFLRN
jgi:hypothetical protein